MPGWRRKLLKRVLSAKPVMYGGQFRLSDLIIQRLQLAFEENLFFLIVFLTVLAFR